jgi:hypothetical protein
MRNEVDVDDELLILMRSGCGFMISMPVFSLCVWDSFLSFIIFRTCIDYLQAIYICCK